MEAPPELPPEVTVLAQGPDSIRYVLPRRELKYGKWLALFLLIVGVGIFACSAWTIYQIAASFLQLPAPRGGAFRGFTFLIAVFGGTVALGGIAPIWWGVTAFLGHRELEVGRDYLRTVERCGPFWRSKRWKVDSIESFEVKPLASLKPGEMPPPIDLAGEFNALLVHPQSQRQGMLAWGYPIRMLAALAQALSALCNQAAERKRFGEASQEESKPIYAYGAGIATGKPARDESEVEAAGEDFDDEEESWKEELDPDAPVSAPAGTIIQFERLEGGDFTATIPPAGLWKGSKGLFFFALLWDGFMTVFTAILVLAAFNPQKGGNSVPWPMFLFIGLFWLVGFGLLLGAINMGVRRAAIALAGGQLMAIQTGIFGSKKREWPLEEIAEVRVGPSGMEMNKTPILELQIVDRKNEKFGFLSERDNDELRWLAYEIRRSLPAKAPEIPAPAAPESNAQSR